MTKDNLDNSVLRENNFHEDLKTLIKSSLVNNLSFCLERNSEDGSFLKNGLYTIDAETVQGEKPRLAQESISAIHSYIKNEFEEETRDETPEQKKELLKMLAYDLYSGYEIRYEDDLNNLIKNEISNKTKMDIDELEDFVEQQGYNLQEEIQNWIYENCTDNITEYLLNTTIDDVTIILNADKDEGASYFVSLYDRDTLNTNNPKLTKHLKENVVLESELKEAIDGFGIDLLMKTQGYNLEDLYDNEKVKNSRFLTSLNDELNDYLTDLDSYNFAFTFKNNTVTLENVIDLASDGFIKIEKGASVGILDSNQGSCTGFEIYLEKDITLNKDSLLLDLNNDTIRYTPADIIGEHPASAHDKKTGFSIISNNYNGIERATTEDIQTAIKILNTPANFENIFTQIAKLEKENAIQKDITVKSDYSDSTPKP